MKLFTLLLTLLICGLITDPVIGEDYPLPKIICYIQGTPLDSTNFGDEFCWVGDQNGDGYDDLLVKHDPDEKSRPSKADRVELFYGGNPMDDQYDRFFTLEGKNYGCARTFSYVGRLLNRRDYSVVLQNYYWQTSTKPSEYFASIYTFKPDWNESPSFIISSQTPLKEIPAKGGHRYRPIDFNGDEYDDLILTEQVVWSDTVRTGKINVYFGSLVFDTIPGWTCIIEGMYDNFSAEISSGYDVNGDGYGDFLIQYGYKDFTSGLNSTPRFSLFLGGSEPDTIPALTWDFDSFANVEMDNGFSLLPDINGDGYDDWGVALSYGAFSDGYYIFFGSDSPDLEVDLILAGNNASGGAVGDICGGDFNGDGYGDIVTSNSRGYHNEGEINITFGHPGLPNGKIISSNIILNGENGDLAEFYMMGQKVGAVGDYNGDGMDDFVFKAFVPHYYPGGVHSTPGLFILAGNREWKVDVSEDEFSQPSSLAITAYPNPINGVVTLSIHSGQDNLGSLFITDINGREAWKMDNLTLESGTTNLIWNTINVPAGVYIVLLQYGSGNQIKTVSQKLVVLK